MAVLGDIVTRGNFKAIYVKWGKNHLNMQCQVMEEFPVKFMKTSGRRGAFKPFFAPFLSHWGGGARVWRFWS